MAQKLNYSRPIVFTAALIALAGGCSGSFNPTQATPTPAAEGGVASSQEIAWGNLPPPPPPPGGRGRIIARGPLCLLTPGSLEQPEVIWSDRPTFIVSEKFSTGSAAGILVYLHDTDTEVWSQAISNVSQSTANSDWIFGQIAYGGESLQSGQAYDWVVVDGLGRAIASASFQVMNPEDRVQINADLEALEARLTAEGATAEEMAFEQAKYFAEKQLSSDAIQVAFGVEQPSAELVEWRNQIAEKFCTPANQ